MQRWLSSEFSSLRSEQLPSDQGWAYRIEKLSNADRDFQNIKSISYRTSNMEYLDIRKTSDFFVFFRRKFRKLSENLENSPKIPKTHEPKSSTTTTTTPKIPKIRQKF